MKGIVCINEINGIGFYGHLPWKSKKDMQYFKKKTIGKGNNAVVMGHNTFKSLGYKPLPNRKNYVLTRNTSHTYNTNNDVVFESIIDNILLLDFIFDEVYIIGGGEIYKLLEPYISTFYVTKIDNCLPCDTFFTVDISNYTEIDRKEDIDDMQKLTFSEYKKNVESP